jgi:hypothetical protein
MYKHNDVWKSKDEFCFIRPIPKEQIYIYSPGVEQPLMGEIVYTNNILLSYGLDVGDIVSFRPDSEYEFNLDGEKLYRVRTDWITWTQEK